jgi:hypothetical protein
MINQLLICQLICRNLIDFVTKNEKIFSGKRKTTVLRWLMREVIDKDFLLFQLRSLLFYPNPGNQEE